MSSQASQPLKILATNFRLADRTPAEVYLRDLARVLRNGDHEIAIYASKMGRLAEELAGDGVTVIQHPKDCPFQPDLIHGQFNLETSAALMHFPDTPAVYMVHGCQQWREHPPMHPRILRYLGLAKSAGCWLGKELALPAERFQLVPNFVEVEQFTEVRRLPEKPLTALVYDRSPSPGQRLEAIRQACRACDMELSVLPDLVGKMAVRPEVLLPQFDLVFASGRSAMEAMAAGCAVLTLNGPVWGELITSENYEHYRDANFTADELIPGAAQCTEDLIARLRAWDWRNLAPVSRRLRDEQQQKPVRLLMEQLYRSVIAEFDPASIDPRAENAAVLEWLVSLASRHHVADPGLLAVQQLSNRIRFDRDVHGQKREELSSLLEAEKEKVRAARRMVNENGLISRVLGKRLEGEWKEIERRSHPEPEGS